MAVSAIVLAAGAGTRMRSDRPKPLHRICGRPMVLHVIHALELLHPVRTVIVVGHGAELVTKRVQETAPAWANVAFVEQVEQNGTGDATAIGMSALAGDDYDDDAIVLVLPGDTPLLAAETLDELVSTHVANGNAATLLTSVLDDPTGYGRVVRAGDQRVLRIVEQRDATPDELDIKEWNTGVYVFRRDLLGPALRNLTADNAQGELYLTDVIGGLAAMGHRVGAVQGARHRDPGRQRPLAARDGRARVPQPHEPALAAERRHDARSAPDVHRRHGASWVATSRSTRARSSRATRSSATAPTSARTPSSTACAVGRECSVRHTVGVDAEIGDGADVGPFAHLPAGSTVVAGATTGPFYTAPVTD